MRALTETDRAPLLAGLWVALGLAAAVGPQQDEQSLRAASEQAAQRVLEAEQELKELRLRIEEENLPLSLQLNDLKSELDQKEREFQELSDELDGQVTNLSNLRDEIELRKDEHEYLAGFLTDYLQKFDARLHIAERASYDEAVGEALLAPEDPNLSKREVFQVQTDMVAASIGRLEDALGGERFEGAAVDDAGLVREGIFVLVGPAAVFRSSDGEVVGTIERRANSSQPAVVPFADPADREAAAGLVQSGSGLLPFDPTLGNAYKLESTQEPFLEHVQKGGAVMVPIFVMAAAALLVALYKWIALTLQGKPAKKRVQVVLDHVARHEIDQAREAVERVGGPVGNMLQTGVEHVREPRELLEEAMYEKLLTSKLRLNGLLPFIAICAAAAPLLGLLGTVTGIINTFELITVFGSGDVKSLSGGISEALITTKFGLIVAIPSLLLHAFLSRKAKGVVASMESNAVALINVVSRHPFEHTHKDSLVLAPVRPAPNQAVRGQLERVLSDVLGRIGDDEHEAEDAFAQSPS